MHHAAWLGHRRLGLAGTSVFGHICHVIPENRLDLDMTSGSCACELPVVVQVNGLIASFLEGHLGLGNASQVIGPSSSNILT
jgi:hypothetical protein